MSGKLLWTGLTLIVASPTLGIPSVFGLVGAIFMAIGVVLCWLDK